MPELLVAALVVYTALGLAFAAWLVAGSALGRFDPLARGAGLAFRAVILPGVAALWPLMLARVLARETRVTPTETMTRPLRRAHRWIWVALTLLILPAILFLSLAARPHPRANPQLHWERFP